MIEKENIVKADLRNTLCAAVCAVILLAPLSVRAQAAQSISQQPSAAMLAAGVLPSTTGSVDAGFLHNASTRYMQAEIKALLSPAGLAVAQACHSDGSACSDDSECCGSCKGGSCCTATGNTCDSSSHCCTHISCGSNGKCP